MQFPINLNLTGRRVLLVGAGRIGLRKAQQLLVCGADLTVIAPDVVSEFDELGVTIVRRRYEAGDAAGFRLVITATGNIAVDQQIFDECESLGIWVNSADDPDRCTFTLPAVHRQGSVMVTVSTGGKRATIIVGKKGDDGLYAKDVSRPMIFTVEETITQDFAKDLNEFVRKEMFDARSFTTNHIEFHRGAETLAFDKSKGADNKDVWKNAAGKVVDTAKIEDLLAKVSNLRAMKFEATKNASLKMPALTITVRFDENKTETVNFAKSGIDVFASRADDPGSATDRKSTRLNSSHVSESRMPSSA